MTEHAVQSLMLFMPQTIRGNQEDGGNSEKTLVCLHKVFRDGSFHLDPGRLNQEKIMQKGITIKPKLFAKGRIFFFCFVVNHFL